MSAAGDAQLPSFQGRLPLEMNISARLNGNEAPAEPTIPLFGATPHSIRPYRFTPCHNAQSPRSPTKSDKDEVHAADRTSAEDGVPAESHSPAPFATQRTTYFSRFTPGPQARSRRSPASPPAPDDGFVRQRAPSTSSDRALKIGQEEDLKEEAVEKRMESCAPCQGCGSIGCDNVPARAQPNRKRKHPEREEQGEALGPCRTGQEEPSTAFKIGDTRSRGEHLLSQSVMATPPAIPALAHGLPYLDQGPFSVPHDIPEWPPVYHGLPAYQDSLSAPQRDTARFPAIDLPAYRDYLDTAHDNPSWLDDDLPPDQDSLHVRRNSPARAHHGGLQFGDLPSPAPRVTPASGRWPNNHGVFSPPRDSLVRAPSCSSPITDLLFPAPREVSTQAYSGNILPSDQRLFSAPRNVPAHSRWLVEPDLSAAYPGISARVSARARQHADHGRSSALRNIPARGSHPGDEYGCPALQDIPARTRQRRDHGPSCTLRETPAHRRRPTHLDPDSPPGVDTNLLPNSLAVIISKMKRRQTDLETLLSRAHLYRTETRATLDALEQSTAPHQPSHATSTTMHKTLMHAQVMEKAHMQAELKLAQDQYFLYLRLLAEVSEQLWLLLEAQSSSQLTGETRASAIPVDD